MTEPEPVVVSNRTPFVKRFTTAVRVIFGVIWLIDAWFKWQPSFRNGFVSMVQGASSGQPQWLKWWFATWAHFFSLAPAAFAYAIALGETLLGVALIIGFARSLTYIFGALWSLLIWMTAEGFGRATQGPATDIGTSIVYALVFVALLALDTGAQTRHFSLDEQLERFVPWWKNLAEIPARHRRRARG